METFYPMLLLLRFWTVFSSMITDKQIHSESFPLELWTIVDIPLPSGKKKKCNKDEIGNIFEVQRSIPH